jgi:hypothetical protein
MSPATSPVVARRAVPVDRDRDPLGRVADVDWCVLATDSAQRGLDHLHIDWADLPTASAVELRALLDDLQAAPAAPLPGQSGAGASSARSVDVRSCAG